MQPTPSQARIEIASKQQMSGEERTREMADVGEGSASEGCVMALSARARSAQSADCHITMFSSEEMVVERAVAFVIVALVNVVLVMSARAQARPWRC